MGNGDSDTWNHPVLGPMVQLGPHGTAPDISWEAYPLPINHPGQVHVLEVEYPSDVPQAMGISLLEPNAAGAVMPIGLDSGVYVTDEEAESPPRLSKHRIVFWPKTKTPLVLITNRREGSRAVYGKITVYSAPGVATIGADVRPFRQRQHAAAGIRRPAAARAAVGRLHGSSAGARKPRAPRRHSTRRATAASTIGTPFTSPAPGW